MASRSPGTILFLLYKKTAGSADPVCDSGPKGEIGPEGSLPRKKRDAGHLPASLPRNMKLRCPTVRPPVCALFLLAVETVSSAFPVLRTFLIAAPVETGQVCGPLDMGGGSCLMSPGSPVHILSGFPERSVSSRLRFGALFDKNSLAQAGFFRNILLKLP